MGYMLDILNEVRRRPGMYIGTPSLFRLAWFLRGYDYALLKQNPANNDPFLEHFRDWIHHRYQTTQMSWEEAIAQHCADDQDAFRHFWELLDEFLNEARQPASVGTSLPRDNGIAPTPISTEKRTQP